MSSNVVKVPRILLPKEGIDKSKYAVIACDQFTSQPKYWDELRGFVGDEVSILNMIFPEIYLSKDNSNKIDQINETMKKYQNDKNFVECNSLVLVERELKNGKKRLGLMIEINLDDYDYTERNTALIKATEKTVVERLPVRIEIRKNATLEFPHIMLLMDDKKEQIIKKLYQNVSSMRKLYDFKLNMNGGHLTGYEVPNSDVVVETIMKLLNNNPQMLFAVGDGNHSLAAAKANWENLKKQGAKQGHPAQYALCELVSIYDDSLEFEPIHRVVLNAGQDLIQYLQNKLSGNNVVKMFYGGVEYLLKVKEATDAIKDIQDALDEYIKNNNQVEIDYIHGDDYLIEVASVKNGIAIFMPTIQKNQLFDYVSRRGVLPRKAFSMGIAEDKRYYFEGRKIL